MQNKQTRNCHTYINYNLVRKIAWAHKGTLSYSWQSLLKPLPNVLIWIPLLGVKTHWIHVHFLSQFVPDVRQKLQQLEKVLDTPQKNFLDVTFRVFNNREDEAKIRRKK